MLGAREGLGRPAAQPPSAQVPLIPKLYRAITERAAPLLGARHDVPALHLRHEVGSRLLACQSSLGKVPPAPCGGLSLEDDGGSHVGRQNQATGKVMWYPDVDERSGTASHHALATALAASGPAA